MKSLNSLYFKRSLFRYFSASSSVRQLDTLIPRCGKIKRKYCRWNIE